MSAVINSKLQASRKELLDIGLRNNLISFKKNAKTLTLIQSEGSEIFDALYVNEKALGFGATEKPARKGTGDIVNTSSVDNEEPDVKELQLLTELSKASKTVAGSGAPAEKGTKGRKSTQLQLQTALDEEGLFLQLLKIRSEAQTYVEEQGVNILFLAIGFLHWFESDSSTEARRAPLVLVPVTLVRANAQDLFKAVYTGDDLIFNLSLAAKLKTDFGIQLPVVDEEAEFDTDALNLYFKKINDAIRSQKRWTVEADELVLGFFSFGKFLMFKDLDPQTWPDDKAPGNPPSHGTTSGAGLRGQARFIC